MAGANYNPRNKEFYYFNRDTLFIYDIRTGQTRQQLFSERCPVDLKLGTNFIDRVAASFMPMKSIRKTIRPPRRGSARWRAST